MAKLYDGQEQLDPSAIASAMGSYLADTPPMSEAVTPTAGAAIKATRQDHQHPRLTSTSYATIAAGSTVQVDFTYRTADGMLGFVNKPGITCTEIEGDTAASAQPAIFKIQSWVTDGGTGRYTGSVIKVWRAQVMPAQNSSLSLSTLLTGLITAVNNLAASISGLNIFGASVVGTQFSCIAVKRSDVA